MNACAACGEAMSAEEAFCSYCGVAVAPPAKQPGAWRRVATGIIGFPLVTSGALLMAFGLLLFAEARGDDAWLGEAVALVIMVFGAGITLLGAPFALAAIVPFGTARRILVGLGAAASGAAFFGIGLADEGVAAASVVTALVAAGLFYLAYHIAR